MDVDSPNQKTISRNIKEKERAFPGKEKDMFSADKVI